MPLLFAYGTLQDAGVQRSTLGRLLHGERDALPGYELSSVAIADPAIAAACGRTHNANVVASARHGSHVDGTVFEVSEAELAAADAYEDPDDYRRIVVTLASGRHAWVYLHGQAPP
jgi:gamma-glutamylcyclotransferase (GGCT)/AIG2-like uncharacterized protein YtfP